MDYIILFCKSDSLSHYRKVCGINLHKKYFLISHILNSLPSSADYWYHMVQITGNVVSTCKCTSSGGRVTCISFAFPFHVTCNQLQPTQNNHIYILLACSRWQPHPYKYTSLTRICLCFMVEYGLPVVNATLFLCCNSLTDHLLSVMPC